MRGRLLCLLPAVCSSPLLRLRHRFATARASVAVAHQLRFSDLFTGHWRGIGGGPGGMGEPEEEAGDSLYAGMCVFNSRLGHQQRTGLLPDQGRGPCYCLAALAKALANRRPLATIIGADRAALAEGRRGWYERRADRNQGVVRWTWRAARPRTLPPKCSASGMLFSGCRSSCQLGQEP